MRTILCKYVTVLLLVLPIVLLAHDGKPRGKHTKEKTIKKEYDVNSDALLKVKNSYGNLNITSWNEDKIVIEVHVKTNGNNEEKVKQKLDEITIDFEASSSVVSARTVFNKKKNGWDWNWGNNNNVNMQINYTIKLPVKNSVHLNNDYGNIVLDRVDGHAKINCDYGRLEIGELRGRNNQLKFDYTSKSSIGYINSGEIRADYSGFTIEKAGDLMIKADYTNSTVVTMKNLQYTSDYGNMEIGEAQNVQGNGQYINVKLGTLHGNVNLTADYGSIRIKEMAEDAGNLQIRTDYTGVKIGYAPEYHFDFEINTEYAGVSGKDDFEISISNEKSTEKYYKGYHGSSNSGNMVYITSDYGGVSFNKIQSTSKN
ncbi:DUF4097 family beta strand repeat-containing protein [Costertonia aggregata]|uniref:DUF4097 family beta strand repeat protein n=1 Tax=Costertonia aggregata TaxID=343403 RepID=A0A7H9ATC6_9FLAO|nr:hypothetical protein [Costertonia aggregata]QLG46455.1 hypothetical protein HYG79_14225 [Costertonia aggregata]